MVAPTSFSDQGLEPTAHLLSALESRVRLLSGSDSVADAESLDRYVTAALTMTRHVIAADELHIIDPASYAAPAGGGATASVALGGDVHERRLVAFSSSKTAFDEADLAMLALAAERIGAAIEQAHVFESERAATQQAEELAELTGHLQRITAELSGDMTLDEVGRTVAEGMSFAYSDQTVSSTLWLLSNGALNLFQPRDAPAAALAFSQVPLGSPYPGAVALSSGEPVWLDTSLQLATDFPHLAGASLTSKRLAVLPLGSASGTFGVLAFGFQLEKPFSPSEKAFLLNVTEQVWHAIDRANLRRMEREAADRAAFSSAVSATLAKSLEPNETLQQIVRLVVPDLVDLATIHLFDKSGGLERVALAHADPLTEQAIIQAGSEGEHPEVLQVLSAVARYGRVITTGGLEDETVASYVPPGAVGALATLDLTSNVLIPLNDRGRALGVLSVATVGKSAPASESVVRLISEVGRRASTAIANSQLHSELQGARQTESFLLRVATALAGASGYSETLEALAAVAVPTLGDLCLIDVLDDYGRPERPVACHRDKTRQPLADRMCAFPGHASPSAHPAATAMRDQRSVLRAAVSADDLATISQNSEHLSLMLDLAWSSHISAPLIAGGETLGSLTLVTSGTSRTFSEADLHLVERFAGQVAEVVGLARRYDREHKISETLRLSALPDQIPRFEQLDISARYRPMVTGSATGSSFYDAIKLPSGNLGVVVGQVAPGLNTAIPSQLTSGIRTLWLLADDPGVVVQQLHDNWHRLGHEGLASALLCTFDPETGEVAIVNAGHALPILVPAVDRPHALAVNTGCKLGTAGGAAIGQARKGTLGQGDTICMYAAGNLAAEEIVAALHGIPKPGGTLADFVVQLGSHTDGAAVLTVTRVLTTAPPC